MTTTRIHARAARMAEAVERGPDGAPVAFLIWPFGNVETDHGTHKFTKRSADMLMREQSTRENLIAIDVDHLSFSESAPPEARRAVGWHRLEVRASGLWAVNVTWTADVRAGLTKDPPEWRYFSPTYEVSKDGEIVSYINTALTNVPATHGVTALAARKKETTTMAATRVERILDKQLKRLAALEKSMGIRADDTTPIAATRDLGHGATRAARLPPREHAELAARFGRNVDARTGVHWDPDHPNDLVFETMTREQARAEMAKRGLAPMTAAEIAALRNR